MFSKLYATSPLLCGEADGGSELAGEVIALLMGKAGLGKASDKEAGRGMLFQWVQIEGSGGGGGLYLSCPGCQSNALNRQWTANIRYKEHSLSIPTDAVSNAVNKM